MGLGAFHFFAQPNQTKGLLTFSVHLRFVYTLHPIGTYSGKSDVLQMSENFTPTLTSVLQQKTILGNKDLPEAWRLAIAKKIENNLFLKVSLYLDASCLPRLI